MATNQRKKSTRSSSGSRSGSAKGRTGRRDSALDTEIFHEISLILLCAVCIFLFLCNFHILGMVGDAVSGFMFGVFGFSAYIAAPVFALGYLFWYANGGSGAATRKVIAGLVLFLMFGVICDLLANGAYSAEKYNLKVIFDACSTGRNGGGIIAGSIAYALYHMLSTIGTVLLVVIISIIALVLLTEKSFVNGVKNGGRKFVEFSKEDAMRRREQLRIRREEAEDGRVRREEERLKREEERERREEERRLKAEEKENEKILRMDKKVSGVMLDTTISQPEEIKVRDDIHEITLNEEPCEEDSIPVRQIRGGTHKIATPVATADSTDHIRIRGMVREEMAEINTPQPDMESIEAPGPVAKISETPKPVTRISEAPRTVIKPSEVTRPVAKAAPVKEETNLSMAEEIHSAEKKVPKKYIFPPLSRLKKGSGSGGDSARELKETAIRLQQTLRTFGVNVTVTDISQGPSVTRYELQPEVGVKVSKIVGLADDIKLNLAATDIRIEAPIPGKAAVGIEVPNKEKSPVALRDLLETPEFRDFNSNVAFAVGKDIAGKTLVADIAKMPHMLIAGTTGSGKSVFMNTIIMSILYKAHPDDVKLIMIDPKQVEFTIYNGIPHLLIPVVTDPKKASAALHWGVSEMEDRYKRFADFNVRDLKSYNQKLETMRERGEDNVPAKMPQIVIIVDELADLMMVAPGEVEASICRLAQLARAAGIHLILATQRPSVDVVTGLIKANMPSRVALSLKSGVDSRTILDMNGAEKLLGNGDMFFYPQGYTKPARIQGAYVSDEEVADVVDFLKNQAIGNVYAEDVEEKIKNIGSGSSASDSGSGSGGSEVDEYFAEAGRFVIDKDKASIGNFQRVFKIGFNRAARIMDQLYEYGVVGEEEGTKPRKVLMSQEQFEQLLEEIL